MFSPPTSISLTGHVPALSAIVVRLTIQDGSTTMTLKR